MDEMGALGAHNGTYLMDLETNGDIFFVGLESKNQPGMLWGCILGEAISNNYDGMTI